MIRQRRRAGRQRRRRREGTTSTRCGLLARGSSEGRAFGCWRGRREVEGGGGREKGPPTPARRPAAAAGDRAPTPGAWVATLTVTRCSKHNYTHPAFACVCVGFVNRDENVPSDLSPHNLLIGRMFSLPCTP